MTTVSMLLTCICIILKCTPEERIGRICRLDKTIYGLKQLSKEWNECFNTYIVKRGYECREHKNENMYMTIRRYTYVVISRFNTTEAKEKKALMEKDLKLSDQKEKGKQLIIGN